MSLRIFHSLSLQAYFCCFRILLVLLFHFHICVSSYLFCRAPSRIFVVFLKSVLLLLGNLIYNIFYLASLLASTARHLLFFVVPIILSFAVCFTDNLFVCISYTIALMFTQQDFTFYTVDRKYQSVSKFSNFPLVFY